MMIGNKKHVEFIILCTLQVHSSVLFTYSITQHDRAVYVGMVAVYVGMVAVSCIP